MNHVPSHTEMQNKYSVNRPGWEVIRQSLYDFQAYAAAGQSVLTFFAVPVGQSGKTSTDTNMSLAGQLPLNQDFLVQSIEIIFFPVVPNVAADAPAAFGAQAIAQRINDTYLVHRTGNLNLNIGSKSYLQEAPLGRFPPKTHFRLDGTIADQSTIAASLQSRVVNGYWEGRPYLIAPAQLQLTSTQNFNVTLNWPEGVQALPSGAPGRIGVVLDGLLYRRSQ